MAAVARLPKPLDDIWSWQSRGSCRGLDSAVFFHPDAERGIKRAARERVAKAVCNTCPVLRQCREYALATHEPYGVWGGLTEEERNRVHAGLPLIPEQSIAS